MAPGKGKKIKGFLNLKTWFPCIFPHLWAGLIGAPQTFPSKLSPLTSFSLPFKTPPLKPVVGPNIAFGEKPLLAPFK